MSTAPGYLQGKSSHNTTEIYKLIVLCHFRIVDLHSHMGVGSSPGLSGAQDTNSRKGITQPWLRSLDGLNTHDDGTIVRLHYVYGLLTEC